MVVYKIALPTNIVYDPHLLDPLALALSKDVTRRAHLFNLGACTEVIPGLRRVWQGTHPRSALAYV